MKINISLWDDKVKGLGLRVAKGGTKTFVLDFRIGKRHRRATLARASEISLKSARERAGAGARNCPRRRCTDLLERKAKRSARAPTVSDALDKYF